MMTRMFACLIGCRTGHPVRAGGCLPGWAVAGRARLFALPFALCLGAPGLAWAQAETPADAGAGPHAHGTGNLAIAAVDTELFIELQLPAMDVVGFEHTAETSKQKKKVDQAVRSLEKGTTMFEPDSSGECELVDVSAGHQMEGPEGTDAGPSWDETGGEEVNPFGESAILGEDKTYTEFLVTYAFACDALPQLRSVKVNLFESFPSISRVTGVFITQDAQQDFSVTPDAPQISVKP